MLGGDGVFKSLYDESRSVEMLPIDQIKEAFRCNLRSLFLHNCCCSNFSAKTPPVLTLHSMRILVPSSRNHLGAKWGIFFPQISDSSLRTPVWAPSRAFDLNLASLPVLTTNPAFVPLIAAKCWHAIWYRTPCIFRWRPAGNCIKGSSRQFAYITHQPSPVARRWGVQCEMATPIGEKAQRKKKKGEDNVVGWLFMGQETCGNVFRRNAASCKGFKMTVEVVIWSWKEWSHEEFIEFKVCVIHCHINISRSIERFLPKVFTRPFCWVSVHLSRAISQTNCHRTFSQFCLQFNFKAYLLIRSSDVTICLVSFPFF